MVITGSAKAGIKRKGFHAEYLAICKAKNIQPLPEVKKKQKNCHVVDFHADRLRPNDWLAVCKALERDTVLNYVAIRLRKNEEKGKFENSKKPFKINFKKFQKFSRTSTR